MIYMSNPKPERLEGSALRRPTSKLRRGTENLESHNFHDANKLEEAAKTDSVYSVLERVKCASDSL